MINQSHMRMLEDELTQLRDRAVRRRATAEQVESLRRMAERMLADAAGSEFVTPLQQVRGLLDTVEQTMKAQGRIHDAARELHP